MRGKLKKKHTLDSAEPPLWYAVQDQQNIKHGGKKQHALSSLYWQNTEEQPVRLKLLGQNFYTKARRNLLTHDVSNPSGTPFPNVCAKNSNIVQHVLPGGNGQKIRASPEMYSNETTMLKKHASSVMHTRFLSRRAGAGTAYKHSLQCASG